MKLSKTNVLLVVILLMLLSACSSATGEGSIPLTGNASTDRSAPGAAPENAGHEPDWGVEFTMSSDTKNTAAIQEAQAGEIDTLATVKAVGLEGRLDQKLLVYTEAQDAWVAAENKKAEAESFLAWELANWEVRMAENAYDKAAQELQESVQDAAGEAAAGRIERAHDVQMNIVKQDMARAENERYRKQTMVLVALVLGAGFLAYWWSFIRTTVKGVQEVTATARKEIFTDHTERLSGGATKSLPSVARQIQAIRADREIPKSEVTPFAGIGPDHPLAGDPQFMTEVVNAQREIMLLELIVEQTSPYAALQKVQELSAGAHHSFGNFRLTAAQQKTERTLANLPAEEAKTLLKQRRAELKKKQGGGILQRWKMLTESLARRE